MYGEGGEPGAKLGGGLLFSSELQYRVEEFVDYFNIRTYQIQVFGSYLCWIFILYLLNLGTYLDELVDMSVLECCF